MGLVIIDNGLIVSSAQAPIHTNSIHTGNAKPTGGNSTISTGNTSVNVPHGLGSAPTYYGAWAKNALAAAAGIYVSAVDGTNITVSTEFSQSTDIDFLWMANL